MRSFSEALIVSAWESVNVGEYCIEARQTVHGTGDFSRQYATDNA